ncbi:MAG: tetraacyldisaccharide 4'-kinase [Syntrophales bacterium]|jgi:tetraacyldisaccharide 4'-kinase
MNFEYLQNIWYGDKIKPYPLIPLLKVISMPYRAFVGLRNELYDHGLKHIEKLPCPIISVGNITVGGTGKTPMVIAIARLLLERGHHPAVISRGYGGKAGDDVCIVSDGYEIKAGYREAGEEAVLIANSVVGVPVMTNPDRARAGRVALKRFDIDALILDDAFQHRRLHRDLDIVMVDALRPFANGLMLPVGPLRESSASLRRAHILIRTGPDRNSHEQPDDDAALFRKAGFHGVILRGLHKPQALIHATGKDILPLDTIRGKKIVAFSGIGRPEHFRKTLLDLGAELAAFHIFPDHHTYLPADLERIQETFRHSGASWMVTTQKDQVKLRDSELLLQQTLVLIVEMTVQPNPETLLQTIMQTLNH